MQYLVSVIDDTTDLATPDEMAAIDVFNDRLVAEGHWVFAGGLGAPEHGHRHRQPGRRGGVHRRAVPGVEGVPRRLLGHRGPRPRRGAQARRRGVEGLQSEGRGAAVPARAERSRRRGGDHPGPSRGVGAGGRRAGAGVSATSTSPRRPRPRRSRPPSQRWPVDGVPPNPGAWLTTTANRKAIDRLRRENKRDGKHKEAQMLYDDGPPEPLRRHR